MYICMYMYIHTKNVYTIVPFIYLVCYIYTKMSEQLTFTSPFHV